MSSKDFLSVTDVSPAGLRRLIDNGLALKVDRWSTVLSEKILVLVFEKPSNRTRVSFDVGMRQLGGYCIYLSPDEVGLGTREPARDVALVLSRYASAIAARTFAHRTVQTLAEYATVPVINALSDLEHPCQAIADIMTIAEHKGVLEGLTVSYVGDSNNCAYSLMLACAMLGMNYRVASPLGYQFGMEQLVLAHKYADISGADITCLEDPKEAAAGADVLYTDAWVSMGEEAEREERLRAFAGYQVDEALLALARPDALLMHCLPAHHGEEVAEGIIYAPQSVVFDQAENRLHAQKALLVEKLGGLEITFTE